MDVDQKNIDVPQSYYQMSLDEIHQRGADAKATLGEDVLVLCHHYQQDGTYWFKDVAGDSLYLAQTAAKSKAKYIVFCGVHFMAESADIVTRDDQVVVLPDLTAGCSMADMADLETVEAAWDYLVDITGKDRIIPVTYINSSAELKAFCGRHNGIVCTSSNSKSVLDWVFQQGKKAMFFPDQHLGRNTGNQLGVSPDKMITWQRELCDGGVTHPAIQESQIILWNGFCSVHARFTVEQIHEARRRRPNIKTVVHPECAEEVVSAADYSGSTNRILSLIADSSPEVEWAVGTELSMVNRLAREMGENRGQYVECLNPSSCQCSTMFQIYPGDVLWVLENLAQGKIVNQIIVNHTIKGQAKLALDRMFALG